MLYKFVSSVYYQFGVISQSFSHSDKFDLPKVSWLPLETDSVISTLLSDICIRSLNLNCHEFSRKIM